MGMNTLTITLLVFFALFWVFVIYRFLRAFSHFGHQATKRAEAIRQAGRDAAEPEAETAGAPSVAMAAPSVAASSTDDGPRA